MSGVKIFEPCEITYPQYDKPVRYTEEFLKEIAGTTSETKIVDEHYGKSIGRMFNFRFIDGGLFVDAESSKSLKRLSPSFDDLTLVDEGDYLLATGGKIVEVASTVNQIRLDNSDDGGSGMADDKTNEYLSKEIDRLHKENAKLEFQINKNKEKLENYDKLEAEVKELREAKEANEKLIEEQKPIVENFKKYQEKRHEELLDKVSNGNKEIRASYEHFSNDDLEIIANTHVKDQPAHGAGADNAPGLDEGDGDDGDGKFNAKDFAAKYEALTGEKSQLFSE